MRGKCSAARSSAGRAGQAATLARTTAQARSKLRHSSCVGRSPASVTAAGVTVGLDRLIDLGIAEPNGEPPRRTVRDAGDDGTELTR